MSEEEVPAGVTAGAGGKLPDVWSAPAWAAPPPPPTWWPQHYYTYEPPPPPRRTSRLKLVAVALLLVVLGASAAATAAIATRGIGGTGNTSGAAAAIVDINTTLAQGAAAGTGMVLTSSGEVLTNNHVIYGALSISVVVTSTDATYSAHVVGFDQRDDIAVLQLDGASGLATMPIGNSSSVQIGDSVTALGNALGRGGAPASAPGTVTALDQSITASDQSGTEPLETLGGMIQINAPIKPGDSGGPLLNSSGQAIGMDTAASGGRQLDERGAVEAFAIPINTALSIASDIVKSPSGYQTPTSGGFLGVVVADSTAPPGAVVDATQAGSPAASSGLVKGDVITAVGGATVVSVASLEQILRLHHPGDNVIVAWVSASGQDGQATVTLATPQPAPPQ